MLDFIAPQPSPAMIDLVQFCWPAFLKFAHGDLRIQVDEQSLGILKALDKAPAILCPNHCSHNDALVMFGLAKALHEHFLFMTAREVFRHYPSPGSLWLQQLGCYSVVRAAADIESFKTTKQLLTEGPVKIVICPEGEISHQNHSLMRLESGPGHAALAAAKELIHQGHKQPVLVVPIATLYRYRQDVRPEILRVLAKVEAVLGLPQQAKSGITARLKRAFETMLSAQENECGLQAAGLNLNQRLNQLYERVEHEVSAVSGITIVLGMRHVDQLHRLKNWFCDERFGAEPDGNNATDNDIHHMLYKSLRRMINFVGISEMSFDSPLTQEQAAEIARILEHETCHEITLKGQFTAFLHVEPALDASNFVKANGAQILTQELQGNIERGIRTLEAEHGSILVD